MTQPSIYLLYIGVSSTQRVDESIVGCFSYAYLSLVCVYNIVQGSDSSRILTQKAAVEMIYTAVSLSPGPGTFSPPRAGAIYI